jgi:hypothetical protein
MCNSTTATSQPRLGSSQTSHVYLLVGDSYSVAIPVIEACGSHLKVLEVIRKPVWKTGIYITFLAFLSRAFVGNIPRVSSAGMRERLRRVVCPCTVFIVAYYVRYDHDHAAALNSSTLLLKA